MAEDWLCNYTTCHSFPPAGDGAAEAFVSIPLTSPSPPPAAQLQASGHLVTGGWETAPQPPSAGAGQSQCAEETSSVLLPALIWLCILSNAYGVFTLHHFLSFLVLSSFSASYPQTPAYSHTVCIYMFKQCIHYLFIHVRCTAGLWGTTATCPLWHTLHTAIESTPHWERVSHQETKQWWKIIKSSCCPWSLEAYILITVLKRWCVLVLRASPRVWFTAHRKYKEKLCKYKWNRDNIFDCMHWFSTH